MVYLGLAVAALCWASVFHIGQYALTLMSPLSAASWRFDVASVLLVGLVAWREGWNGQALWRNAGVLALMASVGVFGFNVGLFYGLQETSAVNGALIVGICPTLTAVLAAALGRRMPTANEVVGLALGLAGVATVVSHGSWAALTHLHLGRGDALVVLASLCWAIYSVLPRFLSGLTPLQVSASTVTGGGLLMTGLALAVEPGFPSVLPSGPGWLAVVAMALFGTVVAYLCWNRGVEQVGSTRSAVFMNFVPLFATLIGALRGQPILGAQLAGAGLVIAGVLCTNLLSPSTGRRLFVRRRAGPVGG